MSSQNISHTLPLWMTVGTSFQSVFEVKIPRDIESALSLGSPHGIDTTCQVYPNAMPLKTKKPVTPNIWLSWLVYPSLYMMLYINGLEKERH